MSNSEAAPTGSAVPYVMGGTDERSRRFIEETTNLPADRFFAAMGPLMVSAWKRKEIEANGS